LVQSGDGLLTRFNLHVGILPAELFHLENLNCIFSSRPTQTVHFQWNSRSAFLGRDAVERVLDSAYVVRPIWRRIPPGGRDFDSGRSGGLTVDVLSLAFAITATNEEFLHCHAP